jgi:hypothetical protein
MKTIRIPLAPVQHNVDPLFAEVLSYLKTETAFPIQMFFDRLPLNPTSQFVKAQLIKRGVIAAKGGILSNASPNGKETKASFKDVNLGLISITVPARVTAKCTPHDGAVLFVFAPAVPVELLPKQVVGNIEGNYELTQIEYTKGVSVVYSLVHKEPSGEDLSIIGDLKLAPPQRGTANGGERAKAGLGLTKVATAGARPGTDVPICALTCSGSDAWYVVETLGIPHVEYGSKFAGTQVCGPYGSKGQAESAMAYFTSHNRQCPKQ